MPIYRVRPGYRHGAGKKYGPGDTVDLTETEAAGFLDKLELVKEEPAALAESTDAEPVETPALPAETRPKKGKRK